MTAEIKKSCWWWFSFCDLKRPKGQQFLGVCIVEGTSAKDALKRSWKLQINPGGQVAFIDLEGKEIPKGCKNRLLGKEEATGLMQKLSVE